ncbi:hypothetical protein BJF92_23080 [Rhizobium rhizosphaerae]|uniref:Uncharacterized protein n=1 Tax=Xaviernesmea rhizosphaerae TaxID=1672749 RepID=A0A1Q9AJI0_9HYPH|nr:hypothetical protein BJF92_23080 [Xaviernesmea rhizosphaerae]
MVRPSKGPMNIPAMRARCETHRMKSGHRRKKNISCSRKRLAAVQRSMFPQRTGEGLVTAAVRLSDHELGRQEDPAAKASIDTADTFWPLKLYDFPVTIAREKPDLP